MIRENSIDFFTMSFCKRRNESVRALLIFWLNKQRTIKMVTPWRPLDTVKTKANPIISGYIKNPVTQVKPKKKIRETTPIIFPLINKSYYLLK